MTIATHLSTKTFTDFLKKIDQELARHVDQKYKEGATNFFKEKVNIKGVRVPQVRKISAKYFREIKYLPKNDIFKLIEKLLSTGISENITIALDWTYRLKDQYEKTDFRTFENWLKKYITNWASCDDFCTHPVGYLVWKYPALLPKVFIWTRSRNRWVKRAAAVTLIHPIRKNKFFLKHVFNTADVLLLDQDDLVQKGYGWMLKVAADSYQKEVFQYVLKHKNKMPRTALRYAIEKMPADKKKEAMNK
ncbi:DNA alkylation repair protein [Patescibacteria group bacterium]